MYDSASWGRGGARAREVTAGCRDARDARRAAAHRSIDPRRCSNKQEAVRARYTYARTTEQVGNMYDRTCYRRGGARAREVAAGRRDAGNARRAAAHREAVDFDAEERPEAPRAAAEALAAGEQVRARAPRVDLRVARQPQRPAAVAHGEQRLGGAARARRHELGGGAGGGQRGGALLELRRRGRGVGEEQARAGVVPDLAVRLCPACALSYNEGI